LGIPEKAVYNYEKALSMNSKSAEAHYNLAVCLYSQ
jgi:TPR repeat protein